MSEANESNGDTGNDRTLLGFLNKHLLGSGASLVGLSAIFGFLILYYRLERFGIRVADTVSVQELIIYGIVDGTITVLIIIMSTVLIYLIKYAFERIIIFSVVIIYLLIVKDLDCFTFMEVFLFTVLLFIVYFLGLSVWKIYGRDQYVEFFMLEKHFFKRIRAYTIPSYFIIISIIMGFLLTLTQHHKLH
ncbi:MAG: hypothetical protein AAFX52_15280 [Pseudomonadota bacterium]